MGVGWEVGMATRSDPTQSDLRWWCCPLCRQQHPPPRLVVMFQPHLQCWARSTPSVVGRELGTSPAMTDNTWTDSISLMRKLNSLLPHPSRGSFSCLWRHAVRIQARSSMRTVRCSRTIPIWRTRRLLRCVRHDYRPRPSVLQLRSSMTCV